MNVTCPHCQESFDTHVKKRWRVSWRGLFLASVFGLLVAAGYAVLDVVRDQQLVASVSQLGDSLSRPYSVFEQISTSIQGTIAKQIRVHTTTRDNDTLAKQATDLIAAERSNKPTNLIFIYFYIGEGDVPLDRWYAKVTYVNYAAVKDFSLPDFSGIKTIAPGTYLEIRS